MTNGLHLRQAEKQVVLAMRATRNEAEATEAKASKAKVELKEDVKKQKLMPKKEEPMIKHDQGHGAGQFLSLAMRCTQWMISQALPSLANMALWCCVSPAQQCDPMMHGTQRLKKHKQTKSCKRRMTSCNSN